MRYLIAATAVLALAAAVCADGANALHEKVLYTQVRIRVSTSGGTVGGSGTVIYSKPKEEGAKEFSTYVLTCQHVVEGAVTVEKFFDPTLGKERKRELKQEVQVEFFDYGPSGRVDRTYSVRGEVMAHDKLHDLALLKLKTGRQADYVADLYPRHEDAKVPIGHEVVAVGCALGHDPILTFGTVTHKGDVIDYYEYWMSNAQIIYGNSGGAVFTRDGKQFLGVPSRVAVVGWGGSAVTHMGYFSPIDRIYTFMDEQGFRFLYDASVTEAGCAAKRQAKKDAAQVQD